MRQENLDKFSDLAYDLYQVRTSSNMRPYILFLGGASSKIEGQMFLDILRRRVLLEPRRKRFSTDEIDKMGHAEQVEHFTQKWSDLGKDFRLSLLSDLQQKAQPTSGHSELAALLKDRYFPLVLTTTLDQLIEATFVNYMMQNGKAPPPWKTLVNSATDAKDATNVLPRFIQPASSIMTIIKLCGSINMESFAVTRGEVDEKIKAIISYLIDLSQYNMVIVGATPLDEIVLQEIFQAINTSRDPREMGIYYINMNTPSSDLEKYLKWHETTYILEEEMNFDTAFRMLVQQFSVFHQVVTIGGTPLDQANFERLRNQQSQTAEQAVVDYLKGSMPQRSNTGSLEALSPIVQDSQSVEAEPTSDATPPTASGALFTDEPLVELYENEPSEPLITLVKPEEDALIQLVRDTTVITVSLRADRRATFTVKSTYYNNFTSQESDELKFNLSDLNKDMHYMGEQIAAFHRLPQVKTLRDGWRAQAKQMGINLYRNLFQPIPELETMLGVARGMAAEEDPANVTLAFSGPRQYLSMPYELLYYRDIPLTVQHPICRQISGVNVRGEHFDNFFYNLRQRKQALRILLIASGTPGTTSDEQVLELENLMGQTIRQRFGFKPVIDKLLTRQASIKAVRDRLRNCRYHIVHYAGHSTFDEATGENSGLTFWQRENMAGERVTLTARELAGLLTPSETRLFYINACVGAEASSEQMLYSNDYLGIMDALVQAKVPYVLGFRWYVTDRGSRYFASLFYQYLFRRPLVPEQAVLHARKRIFEEDPTDETWTSPILVAQTPYQ